MLFLIQTWDFQLHCLHVTKSHDNSKVNTDQPVVLAVGEIKCTNPNPNPWSTPLLSVANDKRGVDPGCLLSR